MITKKKDKKRALITGITGQDGSYLAELLLSKGYEVYGIIRKTSNTKLANISHIQYILNLMHGDLLDPISLAEIVRTVQPNEVYNLAAQSAPGESFRQPIHTAEITGIGTHRMLEAVRSMCPTARFYQASSSEMYGWVREIPQTEETPVNPANPYAAAKVYAHSIANIYKASYGMFVACGILFNHESPRRNMTFVTQKIAYAAACLKLGIKTSEDLNEEGEPIVKKGKVAVGNLDAKRDWGYAGDYVEAMWLMLQQEKPDNFIIATGETHSVRELCEEAFGYVGLDWKKHIKVDPRFVRPTETGPLIGDASKARRILGWKPKVGFKELVAMMVDEQIKNLRYSYKDKKNI